ncbi:hypothetical protein GQ44DRAFT_759946 [Phaeosphaeriaceae sp. PMI808]|nr:hypothetical protein GQ44DRAFT_759946 [Phaeosphaeriaceae sp. PMI808]
MLRFVAGTKNIEIPISDTPLIHPVRPFWYLCSHGRLFDGNEMRRMKALTWFLFLAAGHVEMVQEYKNFREHLCDAITWVGKGVETESISCTRSVENTGTATGLQSKHHLSVTSPTQLEGLSEIRKRTSTGIEMQNGNSITEDPTSSNGLTVQQLPATKRIKLDDTATELRRLYEHFGETIIAFEKKSATTTENTHQIEVLEHKVAQQGEMIQALGEQIQTIDAELKRHRSIHEKEKDQVGALAKQLTLQFDQLSHSTDLLLKGNTALGEQLSKAKAEEGRRDKDILAEKRLREKEEEKRVAVEKQLEEHLEVQEKIAAMYGGIGR